MVMRLYFFIVLIQRFLAAEVQVVVLVAGYEAALLCVVEAVVDYREEFLLHFIVVDGRHDLHALIEVAGHPVGRADEVERFAGVGEDEDARMLEIAVDDAHNLEATIVGLVVNKRAVAAHYGFDPYARLDGFVELLHHALVGDVVHLQLDARRFARQMVLDFVVDDLEELGLHHRSALSCKIQHNANKTEDHHEAENVVILLDLLCFSFVHLKVGSIN